MSSALSPMAVILLTLMPDLFSSALIHEALVLTTCPISNSSPILIISAVMVLFIIVCTAV
jgi:hypothetical protein